jgi:hypothetical protein
LRKTIGETRFALHASEIHTPISRNQERSNKARDALMKNSSDPLQALRVTLGEALALSRREAREAAGDGFEEIPIAV